MHIIAEIQISGMSDPIRQFTSLKVVQSMGGHHKFDLTLPVAVFDESGNPAIVNDSNRLMGKQITFKFKESGTNDILNIFKGIITETTFNKHNGAQGDIILTGYSPTILLENGPHYESSNEKSLHDIFVAILSRFPSNFINSSKIKPAFSSTINYSSQYNESTFNYFKRLANKYGEWFYYDGENLFLGPPDTSDYIDVRFNQNASDLKFSLKILPLRFKKLSYDYSEDKGFASSSSDTDKPDVGSFGNNILDEAEAVYSSPTYFITDSNSTNQAQLDNEVQIIKNQRAANIVVLSGHSDDPRLRIGKVVLVTIPTSDPGVVEDYGKYIITSITHKVEGTGTYQNHFNGVPQTTSSPPTYEVLKPNTEIETAIVKENADPDKYGRLKVQFRWQTDAKITPWIRSSHPYAGRKRGINFTPEVGDEVLVAFNNNDPDNPVVMGSLRNQSALYNNVDMQTMSKFLTSRYCMINMNDRSDDLHGIGISVSKKDSDQNDREKEIFFAMEHSQGKGNIWMEAKDAITIEAPTIHLNGSKIIINGTELVEIKSDKKVHLKATEVIQIESDQKVNQTALTEFSIAAGEKIEIDGNDTRITASNLYIDGGVETTIKSALVKIN